MSNTSYLERLARGQAQLARRASHAGIATLSEMLILILDRSGSMSISCGNADRLQAAKTACIALIDARLNQGADDQGAVMAFDGQATMILPFTGFRKHRDRVVQAINRITIGGATVIKKPLALALKMLPGNGRVHIVLLSDGHGGQPGRYHHRLKDAGAVIETIGVGNDPSDVDEPTLKNIASVLDGKTLYRFIHDADELTDYFRIEIANRLTKGG